MIYLEDADFTLYQGDALLTLRQLPDESVHCVVTSPPYWGLRDYGTEGQLGLEPTPDQYVANMVELFREIRRVLRRDGTCWLNLGDSYAGGPSGLTGRGDHGSGPESSSNLIGNSSGSVPPGERLLVTRNTGLKPKDLVGIPWRIAFALQTDGWYLRSDIIWAKPNPMPESVTDRPTKAHEYLFLLTRSARYFYDADAIREAHAVALHAPGNKPSFGEVQRNDFGTDRMQAIWGNDAGRNARSVWEITTQPYPEAHFATFPEELARRCIAAGTSERGCCPECGAPWERRIIATAPDG